MKVNTDGVLLGAWCRLRPNVDNALLDIGTGSGLIALQLSQRTEDWNAIVEAVEIDPRSARAAQKNFAVSQWANALSVNALSLQKFAKQTCRRFDHIVSNPPFFTDSLLAPDPARSTARHATELTHKELISLSVRLLTPNIGTVSLIVPAGAETENVVSLATAAGLKTTRLTEVHSTLQSGPKRTLIEFSFEKTRDLQIETLVIEDENKQFSAEYRALTRDFYLKF